MTVLSVETCNTRKIADLKPCPACQKPVGMLLAHRLGDSALYSPLDLQTCVTQARCPQEHADDQ
eukprot:4259803-Amphidinium_carterae.1